jgi:hypothetical protein
MNSLQPAIRGRRLALGSGNDETDYMDRRAARFAGDPGPGNSRIYNVADQRCGKARGPQDPEHRAIHARGSRGFKRWRTRLGHHFDRRRTLPAAVTSARLL